MQSAPRIGSRLLLALALSALPVLSLRAETAYQPARKIALTGDAGWDYLTLDPASRRIYVTRGTKVDVLDIDKGELVGEITGTNGVHGVALAPELGRGFASNGRENTVTIFDLKTLKSIGTVKTGANPDAIIYEPMTKRVFAFNGRDKNSTVIAAESGEVVGTIAVGGKPEFAVVDGKGQVFVNVEDTNELLAIDAKGMTVTSRWALAPGQEPTGLAIDATGQRLFAVCHSKHLIVVDAKSGRVVSQVPIGAGVDAAEYDAATHTVFTSNGEGTLSVIRQESPDSYRVIETVNTQKGGRTMALDPKTHHVFVIAAQYTPAAEGAANPRPTIQPGSVQLLEFAPK